MTPVRRTFCIYGKAVPYRHDNPDVFLARLEIGESRLRIGLGTANRSTAIVDVSIWEHTVYELEHLSGALRAAAAEPFPSPSLISRPQSKIGEDLTVPTVCSIEIGYSLSKPAAKRASCFCSSGLWGHPAELKVFLALAIGSKYGEVVIDLLTAKELSDWLDQHILHLEKG